MAESRNPAHITVKSVSLSGMVTDYMKACPPDDIELIIQGSIDRFIFRLAGDDDNPDFTNLIGNNVPLFAWRTMLESMKRIIPVVMVGSFTDNGIQTNAYVTNSHEITVQIYIGTQAEINDLVASWKDPKGTHINYL